MFGHPKGLYMLCLTEMWVRFSFYGMRGILVLYMIARASNGGLGWSNAEALQLYGTYLGIAYLTPLLGGWIADRYIGARASVIFGGILMTVGNILIPFNGITVFYTALALIAIGNGFFKPCVASILGGLYSEKDARRDGAFGIFYMGMNVGALAGLFFAGWLQVQHGFSLSFAATAIGMIFGVSLFWYASKRYLGDAGKKPLPQTEQTDNNKPLRAVEKRRLFVICIVAVIQVAYVCGYEQGGGLLMIYADKHIDRMFGGWEIPVTWFSGLNPLFIILFTPVLSVFWTTLGKRDKTFSFVTKFGLGSIMVGLAFLLLVFEALEIEADPAHQTGLLLMVAFYALFTIAELMVFPVYWSAISRLSPPRYVSLMMAVALSSLGLGSKLAGTVGSYVDAFGLQQVFYGITIAMFILGGICFCLNRKLMQMTEESPVETVY